MAAQKFKIKGKTYKLDENLDKLSLLDIMLFDEQAAEVGLHATWGQVLLWSGEVIEIAHNEGPGAQVRHPRMFLVLTATMWASRRMAGEKVSFGDTVDAFSLADIEWVEPQEATVPKDRLPKKGTKAKPKRQASAPVASPQVSQAPPLESDPTTPLTLSETSESA